MFSRVATGPYFSNAKEVKFQEKDCSKLSLRLTDIYNRTECLYIHRRWVLEKNNSVPNPSVRTKIVTGKGPELLALISTTRNFANGHFTGCLRQEQDSADSSDLYQR